MAPRWFAAFAWLLLAATAFGQKSDSGKLIAVAVDSSEPRIQQMLPELRAEAAKVVEESAKNVRASIVVGPSSSAAEEAREKSADYLLIISLSLRPSVEIGSRGPGTGPATTADVPIGHVPYGIAHSACADLLHGAFTFSYTLTSLTGKNINLHDSHTMREIEYPLGPQVECLPQISYGAVRESASSAVKKLKSKKGL